MEISASATFKTIFPKYAALINNQDFQSNDNIELYIRNQLPHQVQMVRKMQSTFNSFLNQYTNLIVKRPQIANLSYSLASKATELLDKHFKEIQVKYQKMDKHTLSTIFQTLNPKRARQLFRQQFANCESLIREKYIDNHSLARESEEEIAGTLYTLLQLYHFAKLDLVTLASKHQMPQNKIAYKAFKNQTIEPEELAELICLQNNFDEYISNIVAKRCRPFINKRDFFNQKIKQISKESESRVETNLNIFLDSLISKQKHRITKAFIPKIQAVLRNIGDIRQQKQCREIAEAVDGLKRKFMQIKNNSYYIDIIRGNFNQKYKMELNKIENLYYLNNLEKYLQEVFEFMEELLRLEESIIENRKNFKKFLSNKVEDEIYSLTHEDGSNSGASQLPILMAETFEKLKNACYRAENREQRQKYSQITTQNKYMSRVKEEQARQQQLRKQKQQRERQRKQEIERSNQIRKQKQEQQRMRRQQAMADAARKRQEQEDRRKKEKEQLQKRQEQQLKRKAQREVEERRKREQERKKLQEQRKKRQQQEGQKKKAKLEQERLEREKKEAARRQKQEEEDNRKRQEQLKRESEARAEAERKKQQELARKRQQEQNKKKLQQERKQENKRKQDEERRKQEELKAKQQQKRREQERKRQQQQAKRRKDEEDKRQKQAEEKKKAQEKRKQQQQQRRKDEQNKRLAEEKRKQQERKRLEEQRKRKQEQQKERKRKQEERRKEQQQRARKEQEQRERKQELKKQQQLKKQQELKRQQEERKKKQAEQKRRKQEQQRKRKQEEETIKKQQQADKKAKQQAEEKKKKQQAAKAVTKKNEPPKKSAINYADLDDEVIDENEHIKTPVQPIPTKAKKNEDDQYLQDYEDDFDDFSPDKEDEDKQNMQIEPKRLIDEENVKCINEYLKGTSYARKNRPNLQPFNNKTQYAYLFEELVQNKKLFIYETSISKALYDFSKQLQDQSLSQEDLELTLQTIKDAVDEAYQKLFQTREIDPRTKLIFPFSFANEFNIYLIQLNIYQKQFMVIFGKQMQEDEAMQQKFSSLIEAFMHIYEFEEPQVKHMQVPQQSKAVLDTFDKELPNLLLLFALHYEQNSEGMAVIKINQYTIQRFFYISQILEPLYKAIEQEGEKLSEFYDHMAQKFFNDPKINIKVVHTEGTNEDYEAIIATHTQKIKEQFLTNKGLIHSLVMLQISIPVDEESEQKIILYLNMSKDGPKPALNYYIVSKDEQDQQNLSRMFELASGEIDDQFETTVYMDFTRHNGLTQYSDWTLPLWAHIVQKKKMSPLQAFRAMTLGMTPYYVTYKQMD